MGMCKGCGVVYSALIMKDGYCKDCKPDLFSEIEINQIEINQIEKDGISGISINENQVEKPKPNKNLIMGVLVVGALLGVYFLYDFLTTPSSSIVKELATNYKYANVDKIKILKSYEDKGKLVYVLEIYNSICEMPVIKTSNGWSATGMSCSR